MTQRQETFVQEYLVDLCATQAAIRAGYSARTAYSQGQRLLRNAEIKAAIDAAIQARANRTDITQDFVLKKLYEIASRTASDMPRAELHYSNKIKALELLGKHLGMFTETSVYVSQSVSIAQTDLSDLSMYSDDQLCQLLSVPGDGPT